MNLKFWAGETNKPVLEEHTSVMDSAINYLGWSNPSTPYKYRELFLDSGAFTLGKKRAFGQTGEVEQRKINLIKEKIKQTQEKMGPDKAIPLDFPFQPGMDLVSMKKYWSLTTLNFLEWQETTSLKEIVPVLHAWSADSLAKNVKWLSKYADSEMIAIGTIVTTNFKDYTGFFGDRQPSIKNLALLIGAIQSIRSNTDFKIHLTGFGSSPLTLHLAFYIGSESVDSAGYRRKAAYGKILLPGTGEKYVGRGDAKFGVSQLTSNDKMLLKNCLCPICRVDQSLLYKDWKARAIHNKYVLESEAKKAKKLLNYDFLAYEHYLEQIYRNSSTNFISYWKFVKNRIRQYSLDLWLL
jgi:queuine/archaeosine tRNA-ribosyltransferase